ncbi:hypothetical protein BJY27_006925 [Streptomyces rapamycinicus]|uniref:Transposase n=1 Tax=Streptomyces rapamycinicus TaxID=1226757 RepID=A0ABR6LUR8_9ACTN|nr:hypothetical protein [Streptomyces rapamycinicus]
MAGDGQLLLALAVMSATVRQKVSSGDDEPVGRSEGERIRRSVTGIRMLWERAWL